MSEATFSAISIMVCCCADGSSITAGEMCANGEPPSRVELSLLTGKGGISFEEWEDESKNIERAKAVDCLAVLRKDGEIIASIPRSALDDKTVSLFWNQMNEIGKAMRAFPRVLELQREILAQQGTEN